MTDTPHQHSGGPGCLTLGLLFGGVSIAGWVVTILLYGVVIEQWELVTVRREFGYDMGLLWAPLIGLVLGAAACFWATRGPANARRAGRLAGLAMLSAVLLLVVFAGLGTIL